MRNVLADLALESEAALVLALHLAAAVDAETGHGGDPALARIRRRILTPAAKFWVCKRTIACVAECMEVWGGNGYVDDGPMPRLLREAPVNSIWEGSGNVMCLDVLRALAREPDAAALLFDDLADGCAGDAALTRALHQLKYRLRATVDLQWQARHIAGQLVVLTQACLLRRHAPQDIADAFIASRIDHPAEQVPGLLAEETDVNMLLTRCGAA